MAKLNHQPFEEWLLSEDTLAPQELRLLQEHLNACEDCRRLAGALGEVDRELRTAPAIPPAPGFVSRWQTRLAADRIEQQRRQTLWSMVFSIGGAMALMTIMGILLYPILRAPLPFLLAMIYQLTSTFVFAGAIGGALMTVMRTIVKIIPPTQWAAILVALSSLSALWVVAMHRLSSKRRVIQ
jgi:hypothetical protein